MLRALLLLKGSSGIVCPSKPSVTTSLPGQGFRSSAALPLPGRAAGAGPTSIGWHAPMKERGLELPPRHDSCWPCSGTGHPIRTISRPLPGSTGCAMAGTLAHLNAPLVHPCPHPRGAPVGRAYTACLGTFRRGLTTNVQDRACILQAASAPEYSYRITKILSFELSSRKMLVAV